MSARKTIKKEKFAHKFIETGNASEAYRFAYNTTRMKPESVRRLASKLLKDIYVRSTIRKLRAELLTQLDLSAEEVLRECARIAFLDPRKFFNEDNSIREIPELDIKEAAAIARMDIYDCKGGASEKARGYIRKIRFHDKIKALDQLARTLGLYSNYEKTDGKLVIIKDFSGDAKSFKKEK